MNLLNAYLLVPLQRKIFKNFGHYDYQTSTFHLNEERVNEVCFDPAYNPFVDVLRETAHASAVASSKASVQPPRSAGGVSAASLQGSASPPSSQTHRSGDGAGTAGGVEEAEQPRLQPCVQLLQGRIRSAGLVSFLRQATSQKSLAVEAVDLIFSVAAAPAGTAGVAPVSSLPEEAADAAEKPSSPSPSSSSKSRRDNREVSASDRADAADGDSAVGDAAHQWDDDDEGDGDGFYSMLSPSTQSRYAADAVALARSYSLEDHSSAWKSAADAVAAESRSRQTESGSAPPAALAHSGGDSASSPFHTVGDLMRYVKQQLQGITVGVEEVRLTFCVPSASGVQVSLSAEEAAKVQPPLPVKKAPHDTPPMVRKGTRVLHLSCRRGLRFTVDNATGAAVQDVQCTAVVNDWQCYLHVMAHDGPVPTTFALDELLMTTTATVNATADREGSAAPAPSTPPLTTAPITVHVSRCSGPSLPSSTALPAPPQIALNVDAAGGWCAVLTAAQLAHLADVAQVIASSLPASDSMGDGGESVGGTEGLRAGGDGGGPSSTPPPSLSSRWSPALTAAMLERVDAAPLESGEALTAAAMAAAQLRSAATYVSVHCAGCSVTLLTQAAVPAGVVARAWRAALPPQHLAVLSGTDGHGEPKNSADAVGATVRPGRAAACTPVFEGLASPHLTYVMRDLDFLFPSVDAGGSAPTSSNTAAEATLNPIFSKDKKKRTIYRNLFKNNLVDGAVTESLARMRQLGLHDAARSLFLGVRSISLVEYRQAAPAQQQAPPPQPQRSHRILRPARVLHAERLPYALVLYHRSTEPIPEKPPAAARGPTAGGEAGSGVSQQQQQQQQRWCAHHETIVVGLASIAFQLDPAIMDVVTSYGLTLARAMQTIADVAGQKSEAPAAVAARRPPPCTAEAAAEASHGSGASDGIHSRSSVKVLLESVEASLRFPLKPFAFDDFGTAVAAPPTSSAAPALSLLARLLQRLQHTSLYTHRQVRADVRRRARASVATRDGSRSLAEDGHSTALRELCAVQEALAFPEDARGDARFLAESLRFSLRDLQLVQTASSTTGGATTEPPPPCLTSIKWREAVVSMQDVLEKTTAELFRVDYSPEMSIQVTHAGLSDGEAGREPCLHALRRVLLLQARLGDVTTTMLTQDDYLLASHFVSEVLRMVTHCRQRLHALTRSDSDREAATAQHAEVAGAAASAAAAPGVAEGAGGAMCRGGSADRPNAGEANAPARDARDGGAVAAAEAADVQAVDAASGTVAEAFALADAHSQLARRVGGATRLRQLPAVADGAAAAREGLEHEESRSCGVEKGQGEESAAQHAVAESSPTPDLWSFFESTCTALDVRIGRIRLGLFAPRLSPMNTVVGEPLLRCLPAAQRRQLVDLTCLYHAFLAEVVGVSLGGLIGDGRMIGKGQETFFAVDVRGLSLWERQPVPMPLASGHRRRSGGGGGGAPSSLYASYVAGAAHASGSPVASPHATPERTQQQQQRSHAGGTEDKSRLLNCPGTRRDLDYYLSHKLHRSSTLVQHLQSYSEASHVRVTSAAAAGDDEEEVERGDGVDGRAGARRAGHRILRSLWNAYVAERHAQQTRETPSPLPSETAESGEGDADVCRLRFLEHVPSAGEPRPLGDDGSATRDGAGAASPGPTTRHVHLRLAGLGLHHRVAYNGDHIAATLKNFFAGDGGAEGTGSVDKDTLAGSGGVADAAHDDGPPSATVTEVRLELRNLLATYRPRGVGRSLAVALLPCVSVLVTAPLRRGTAAPDVRMAPSEGAKCFPSAPAPVVAMQAEAWLRTPLPIYVCNDCDVDSLAREVLDLLESEDWGTDLEGAGFVRLCEVVSTAPHNAASASSAAPASSPGAAAAAPLSCRPNLTVTLPQQSSVFPREHATAAVSAAAAASEAEECGEATVESQPAIAVQLRYVELSAFMAKDTFDVFRELVETWAAGADLQTMETPAALVMRSGPGFEWVAEEVARSCAPMTFRLNPALLREPPAAQATGGDSEAAVAMAAAPAGLPPAASVDDFTGSHPAVVPHALLASYTQNSLSTSSPAGLPETGLRGDTTTATSLSGGATTLPTYSYNSWRGALHAALGEDQQLAEAYQSRVAALLDPGAAWVPPAHGVAASRVAAGPASRSAAAAARTEGVDAGAARMEAMSVSSEETVSEEECGSHVPPPPAEAKGFSAAAPPYLAQPHSASSLSSSFSDLSDLDTMLAPLQWRTIAARDPAASFSESTRRIPAAVLLQRGANALLEDDVDSGGDGADSGFDLCAACELHPHFLSCWSRRRPGAAAASGAVRLDRLERTDDALLHDGAERYLYPPVQLEFFLSDCALHVSLYEGTDLMAAAVRKQRRGYLQIVSRGAHVAQAAPSTHRRGHVGPPPPQSWTDAQQDEADGAESLHVTEASRWQAAPADRTAPSESSAARLRRLDHRGCRSGFGDRDASKRLVLSCCAITVQFDSFPQAAEEDVWFHVVVGEVTVFDCIQASDVHRLLTATPQPTTAAAPATATKGAATGDGSGGGAAWAGVHGGASHAEGGLQSLRQLELTGLLQSSKSVHVATQRDAVDDARVGFAVSHFQQGGSELSLVVRLQPTSLTWSGASVDFAQSFFVPAGPSCDGAHTAAAAGAATGGSAAGAASVSGAASAPVSRARDGGRMGSGPAASPSATDDGVISGTEAPAIFFRRLVILPTTLTVAGSFQSDKGVIAALAEGKSLDALRSVPVLSWISLQEIPLPIPLMRIDNCGSAVTLLQRIVEDSNCVSIRFLLTALCCGLQPLSAVARVGEAAKGLLLLPLSQYRGAALHHAIRTASSVFMQELLAQSSGVAALLASGSFHASRSLLGLLVAPPEQRRMASAEPSRAAQPAGVAEGWRQGQEQLRTGLEEALSMATYCTGPDGSLLRLPAAALRILMGLSGAATTTLWGVRNSQDSTVRDRDGFIYKK